MIPRKADTSFLGHLDDVRARLMKCLVVYFIACAGFSASARFVLDLLTAPAGLLVFTAPADAFMAYWNVVLWGGFVFASPYFLYHFWAFVGQGLLPAQKRLLGLYGPLSFLFFVAGGMFAFFVVMPMTMQFFLGYATEQIRPLITLDKYVAYTTGVVLAFAMAFQLPLVLFILTRLGLVTTHWLRAKRKYAIIAVLVGSAILTPPDVVSQLMLAVPMLLLYELGVWFSGVGATVKK